MVTPGNVTLAALFSPESLLVHRGRISVFYFNKKVLFLVTNNLIFFICLSLFYVCFKSISQILQ